ncbi:substrate-binding periplasmic protein [Chitinimonas sp.]|uniref:substrate-binding periplasmic protein n=1 Tax=Chitinimonas sp. TaxID=1934313 RepID=UPI002F944D18
MPIWLMLLGCQAWAGLCGDRPLVVGAFNLGPGMQISQTGEPSGAVPDFLTELSRRTGCRFSYAVVPAARAYLMLRQGQLDVIGAGTRSPEREIAGQFLRYARNQTIVLIKTPQSSQPPTLAALLDSQPRFSLLRGYDFGPEARRLALDPRLAARLEWVVDPETAVRKLKAGHTDATMGTADVFYPLLKQQDMLDEVTLLAVPGGAQEVGMYLSRQRLDTEVRNTLAEALAGMVADSTLPTIAARHYPEWLLRGLQFDAPPRLAPSKRSR